MRKLALLLAAALCSSPLLAQDSGTYANMGTCTAGNPRMYFVVDAVTTGSCAAGGGTGESQCCCLGGSWANCAAAGSGAPTTADYLVKTADGGLSAERVVTDTSTITWDWATGGQAKANVASVFLPASSPPAIDAAGGVWGEPSVLAYEGNVADTSETRIIAEEPTADRYFQIPNLTGYAQLSDCATCYGTAANSVMTTTNGILFEGATANAFETTFVAGDPTADRTITLPDNTGTVLTTASNYAASISAGGPATTATAFVANPADCSTSNGTEAAWQINASGDLSCTTIETNYLQYDPDDPPSSCNTCDEFTSGTTLTWSGQNLESSTMTAGTGGVKLFHPTDSTGIAVWWTTGPAGSSADWVAHARLNIVGSGSWNAIGLALLSTGTEGTPTLIHFVTVYTDGTSPKVGFRSATSYTSAQTTLGTNYLAQASGCIALGYVTSTKVLSAYYAPDCYGYTVVGTPATLAAHPTTSFGLMIASLSASTPANGFVQYFRIRTDGTGVASPFPVGE